MTNSRLGQSKSVLIVDDDAEALAEMTESLVGRGLTVHAAVNGAEAVLLAAEHRPAFILMDYSLPGANGLESMSSIRRFLPFSKVIMMSGYDDFCGLATTQSTETFAILKKPLAMNSIARFIRNRLDSASGSLDDANPLATQAI